MKNLDQIICYDENFSSSFIIFGGTGDLTHRKLMPSLYNLYKENLLPTNFPIISIGRRDYTKEIYLNEIKKSLIKYTNFQQPLWNEFKNRIYYIKLNFTEADKYCSLNEQLKTIENEYNLNQRIFYLAASPEYFESIIDNLRNNCMGENKKNSPKVVIEKPFGRSLESAYYLNQKLVKTFKEENIYRIDHYLGKEMLQSIIALRFANPIFDAIWNKEYIEQVQITASETLGIETRGNYYETSGAIRDMLQSHLLQLLSLIAMEKPTSLTTEAIRDEKVKALKHLRKYNNNDVNDYVVRGQYQGDNEVLGYLQEINVNPKSNTETFVAIKANIDNDRWQGIPFYIRTGKRMKEKKIEIIIEFKQTNNHLFDQHIKHNYLIIKIQPQESISLQFNTKQPGPFNRIIPVNMDFCQNCESLNKGEAYERLLYDIIREDTTLFTRWDEVEESWKFVDNIIGNWAKDNDFPKYQVFTNGPIEADQLLGKDQKYWLNFKGESDENI